MPSEVVSDNAASADEIRMSGEIEAFVQLVWKRALEQDDPDAYQALLSDDFRAQTPSGALSRGAWVKERTENVPVALDLLVDKSVRNEAGHFEAVVSQRGVAGDSRESCERYALSLVSANPDTALSLKVSSFDLLGISECGEWARVAMIHNDLVEALAEESTMEALVQISPRITLTRHGMVVAAVPRVNLVSNKGKWLAKWLVLSRGSGISVRRFASVAVLEHPQGGDLFYVGRGSSYTLDRIDFRDSEPIGAP